MRDRRGVTLPEILVVLVLIGLAAAIAVPAASRLESQVRTASGARKLAMTFYALRWSSVARGRSQGLMFAHDAQGWYWYAVEDGNGNGLKLAEIANGVDPRRSGPHRLEHDGAGATLGFPPGGPFPKLPPQSGSISDLDDPIKMGNTDLVAFTPLGTASSGTLYVTDRKAGLYAVVLYGRSARVRVWRYDSRGRRWTL